jgi:hypothetical protein
MSKLYVDINCEKFDNVMWGYDKLCILKHNLFIINVMSLFIYGIWLVFKMNKFST